MSHCRKFSTRLFKFTHRPTQQASPRFYGRKKSSPRFYVTQPNFSISFGVSRRSNFFAEFFSLDRSHSQSFLNPLIIKSFHVPVPQSTQIKVFLIHSGTAQVGLIFSRKILFHKISKLLKCSMVYGSD